jgi:hypothetical protein
MKIKKFLLILLAIILFLFGSQLPAFIYNELEWRGRVDYRLIENFRVKIDYLIGIRTGETDVLASDEEKRDLVDDIDKGLEAVTDLLTDYDKILAKQDKLPFLPKQYREYQQQKRSGFADYRLGEETFIRVKVIEHRVARIITQLDQVTMALYNGQDLKTSAAIAKIIARDMDQLYQEGKITAELNGYINQRAQNIIDLYGLLDSDLPTSSITQEAKRIAGRGMDVDFTQIVNNWHKEIIDILNQEYWDKDKQGVDKFIVANQYYTDNKLAKDIISVLLSSIFKKYPKNI